MPPVKEIDPRRRPVSIATRGVSATTAARSAGATGAVWVCPARVPAAPSAPSAELRPPARSALGIATALLLLDLLPLDCGFAPRRLEKELEADQDRHRSGDGEDQIFLIGHRRLVPVVSVRRGPRAIVIVDARNRVIPRAAPGVAL